MRRISRTINFVREYGVSLRHLVPVAEPAQESRCVLIYIEPGRALWLVFSLGP